MQLESRRETRLMALADVSADVLEAVAALLDVSSLLALEEVCRALRLGLRDLVPQRCKRECFTAYLFPTIATYRMQAPVPTVCDRVLNGIMRMVMRLLVMHAFCPTSSRRGCACT